MKNKKTSPKNKTRSEQKKDNKASIIGAAMKVFADIGLESSTVRDIIRESGLAVGTFYNYYNDKNEIFHYVIAKEAEAVREKLKAIRNKATTPEEFIGKAFEAFFEAFSKDRMFLIIITRNQQAFRNYLYDSKQVNSFAFDLEIDMENAIKKKLLPSFNAKFVSWSMVSTGLEFLNQMTSDASLSPKIAADFLTDMYLFGMQNK